MTEAIIEMIKGAVRRSCYYKGGESFDAGNFSGGRLPKKVRSIAGVQEIADVLEIMADEGEIVRVTPIHYRRWGSARELLSRPWRSHSNAELGIESRQFGVMV